MFHTALIKDGQPVLGTEFQRIHKVKTWQGVARRILAGPRPDHAPTHTFEVRRLGEHYYGAPLEVRRIEVTLTTYKIGPCLATS